MTFYSLPLATPRASATSARREMTRLFEDVLTGRSVTAWQPPVDTREDATGYTIEMDVPGVSPDTVEVLAEDGVLTVRGTRPTRELSEGERILFAEKARGAFVRRFRLPKAADLQSVSATYAHGVLQVRIAKVAPAQPRRVQVTVASDVAVAAESNPSASAE